MVVYKKLTAVSGSFQIIHAEGMVKDTLNASGLGIWLSDEALEIAPEDAPSAEYRTVEYFELEAAAALRVEKINAWAPWAPIQENQCAGIRFNVNSFGLGIGAAGASMQQARNYLGEFVAAGGQVAIQPPDEYGRPDCLLTEQAFIPELYSIQRWIARGNMAGTESSDLYGHFHAAVFPYQFLPNGPLSFPETARQIFEGPPPKAVMHLISDERPGIGIGESALYHGACWFAPISGCEVIS
jgi:hypothetical protein